MGPGLLTMRWLLVLRAVGPEVLLRRRCCSGPLLLLLGVALCLCYQTLMLARDRLRSDRPQHADRKWPSDVVEETRMVIEALERFHSNAQAASQNPSWRPRWHRAVVLTGRRQAWDTEVQLYQRVLPQLRFNIHASTYAETSGLLRDARGEGGWNLLLCLRSAEQSCLRRVSFSHLRRHQMVNLIPGLVEAFSDAGSGLCHMFTWSSASLTDLPMSPFSCRSTNHRLPKTQDSPSHAGAPPPGLVTVVNVCVLVTSLRPLTSFLHDAVMVTTNQEQQPAKVKLREFLARQLGPQISHQALGQVKRVIGDVLQAAASTNDETGRIHGCVSCFQLLTFTLMFSGSLSPVVVQVDTDVTFSAPSDTFDGQISRDLILEDTLHFLLSSETQGDTRQHGGCKESHGLCLSEDDWCLLLQFHRRMVTAPPAFLPLLPSSSSCSSPSSRPRSVSDHVTRIGCYYLLQSNGSSREEPAMRSPGGAPGGCIDPHLRQIYTQPPLSLTPPFDPHVKEYRAEVTFDTVTVRIRPLTVSSSCAAHLDEHRGPRIANYPVGLGNSRISILVTDDAEADPVVMTIYTIHVFRENRPSLPMFGDHVTCGLVQDCGLLVRPSDSCGLHPLNMSTGPLPTCPSGHQPGRWVVPCLSCSDNRTCDWRDVAWQPDGCSHPWVARPLLQACMRKRKVLFIGDSTNRGMMYFLMERVNSSLDDWVKGHDLLVYRNLNAGQTQLSYSYYPQFWLDQVQRPTFRQALQQLLHRSRPLVNSNLTVLVVGGVQWLNTNHLRTISDVLDRERLSNILVVVKTLGMGFHLPVDGIRSLSLRELQRLDKDNNDIIAAAKNRGYEVIDTFSITMGRYKEFLQGRCACHFHEVETFPSVRHPHGATSNGTTPSTLRTKSAIRHDEQGAEPDVFTYHVRGPVNKVYSEILLSRLCHTHT